MRAANWENGRTGGLPLPRGKTRGAVWRQEQRRGGVVPCIQRPVGTFAPRLGPLRKRLVGFEAGGGGVRSGIRGRRGSALGSR